jgi:serine protease Do
MVASKTSDNRSRVVPGVKSFEFVRAMRRGLLALGVALFAPLGISPAVARGAPDSFSELASRLLPTVVNIATTQTLKPGDASEIPDLPPDSPLQELFKDYLNRNRNVPRHVTALGSGFVIDPSGLIVTNNHVIDEADEITVTLNDGTSLPAKLVGRDPKSDLALVKVNPPKPLAFTHFGDSDHAHVGDWVIAIGNPFGLGSTVTAGIVSARNRDIAAGPYDDFIQTDAPINRGNSGGPLFDMDGNVVGVNSAIFSPSGGSVGIGFSIPSNMAREVIDQLRQYGAARRGWLGVRIQQVTSDIAEGLGLPGTQGALVADVTVGGPAAKGGVENGDLILDFDGKPVADSRALPRIVADTAIGKAVNVDLWRKGKKETVRVTVAKLEDSDTAAPVKVSKAAPPPPKPNSKLGQLGLTLGLLDDGSRNKYHVPNEVQGAVVTDVDPNSPAGEKNFRPGDVIVEVQSQAVHSPDDVTRHLESDSRAGRKIELLLVSRDGVATYVALRLAEG